MDILIYLLILLAGAFLGSKDQLKLPLMNRTSEAQTFALLFLLFIMGVKIGIDKEIIYSFSRIGLQGFLLALSSVIFSVLGVKMISNRVLRVKEGQVEDDN
ncbi:LysO family transporter [Alkaliphilus hydrothermalis]|uniref:Transporter YbjL n=1 Tax=Alkaliphilus hydrothermalis TaxID=1482730 RepID=A0ABS2NM10_9FIRM|nr:LysO family transporter [Alkaliphilus hydrothermalis]MBM7613961.1 putative transporter YbjL [Alkaliphilus hydrothermalis]